jgi:ElaB/YqjD/DUF883 family membrane-anchored ribosome-binding protein
MSSASLPPEILEQRAAEQRRRLHESVVELKSTVREEVREHLDVNRYAREYFWQAAGSAAVLGLVMGYSFAGMFTRR